MALFGRAPKGAPAPRGALPNGMREGGSVGGAPGNPLSGAQRRRRSHGSVAPSGSTPQVYHLCPRVRLLRAPLVARSAREPEQRWVATGGRLLEIEVVRQWEIEARRAAAGGRPRRGGRLQEVEALLLALLLQAARAGGATGCCWGRAVGSCENSSTGGLGMDWTDG